MKRLGFHYYNDIQHYRRQDQLIWLPRLESLGAQWLVLRASTKVAIPENFIQALINTNIQPVIHFDIHPKQIPDIKDLVLLFNTYHRWGVRYITLFDQPNNHRAWPAPDWAQSDLVERFLDLYLPLADACLHAGLTPIFPPLKPGGDYWDTAFLRQTFLSLQRRKQNDLLEQMVIGAYSNPGNHPIQWGAGGPERWPNTRPYFTPPGVEDQCGFRIFDWYIAISNAILSKNLPIFLFGMGYSPAAENYIDRNLAIARLLNDEFIEGYEAIPECVLGGAFDFLTHPDDGSGRGWFHQNGELSLQAESFIKRINDFPIDKRQSKPDMPFIKHYLLLPSYEWGISDYHLDIIRPFIKKHQPTVGFSIKEASYAKNITVIGGEESFSENSLNKLRAAGVTVNRIEEDGINIASKLASL
jgi:hypothetical protein